MKVFISTDMEGVAGTTRWCDVTQKEDGYDIYREQMTREVAAACEGALGAGATDILIKDAHASGQNLITERLPKQVRIINNWGTHPYFMMQGIDKSFDAAMMIGYHTMAGGYGNPLAHTISSEKIYAIAINDCQYASEFLINTYTAALEKVPVVMVTGDQELCDSAVELVPGITSVPVKEGIGGSTVNMHPDMAVEKIRKSAQNALEQSGKIFPVALPKNFKVQITYINNQDAYEKSFYPGVRQVSARTISFESADWYEVLRMILFVC